jgi:biopolymer transport protein ExbD
MKTRLSRHFHAKQPTELNITAFMNLMVVLVPFLLITAVFTRITILELNLPPPSEYDKPEKPRLALEVIVRKNAIYVQDRNKGLLRGFPNKTHAYDTVALSNYLRTIKARFVDITSASVLLEPDIPYETLVLMMDTLRSADIRQNDGSLVRTELFPDISIGDAPLITRDTQSLRSAKR